jgi:hypothetical protein
LFLLRKFLHEPFIFESGFVLIVPEIPSTIHPTPLRRNDGNALLNDELELCDKRAIRSNIGLFHIHLRLPSMQRPIFVSHVPLFSWLHTVFIS